MGGEETKRGSMIFSSVRGHPTRGEWGLFFVEVGASVLISDVWIQHARYLLDVLQLDILEVSAGSSIGRFCGRTIIQR